jgi:hypothetical protein
LLAKSLVFLFAAVAPINLVRFTQSDHFIDPGDQPGVLDISGWIHQKLLIQKIKASIPLGGADLNPLIELGLGIL